MPAPSLKHFTVYPTTTATTTLVPAVPAGRALVGRVVVSTPSTTTISIRVNGSPIIEVLSLSAGQSYEQAGVVVLAGATITVSVGTANTASFTFFGEEVDN